MFYLFTNKKSNPKNFLKHYKRSSKIENNNKNNSNGNGSELTRQIKEFQWIYPRPKCLREIMSYHSKSHRRVESADEVYELLSQERSRLQELYVKCAANGCWKDVP
ncbi:hypothetical protein Glove_139g312 [Diversispora epigaea]|uniref:Uncharacterized protein n=1 Tax=Diversispora epigaea TaxID=1348612 RepID=A0A397IVG9_9GLOM|nr:hypothetical protein Glove_139g312 [Diversispora epigaea]